MASAPEIGSAELDLRVKLAVYGFIAERGAVPEVDDVATAVGSDREQVLAAYVRLYEQRVLVLQDDGVSILMAPPFSGVPTQHVAEVGGLRYYTNCAWDVLGAIAALGGNGVAHSRCEQTREPLRLEVTDSVPEQSDWLFHCLVPASHWWDDIAFT